MQTLIRSRLICLIQGYKNVNNGWHRYESLTQQEQTDAAVDGIWEICRGLEWKIEVTSKWDPLLMHAKTVTYISPTPTQTIKH